MGHAASPAPRPGPAAGGCAFGRMRGSASQAMRPHPCKLVRAIHGALRPHNPTPTAPRQVVGGPGAVKGGEQGQEQEQEQPSNARLYPQRGGVGPAGNAEPRSAPLNKQTPNSPLFPCAPTQCPRDGGYGFTGPSTAWVRRMRRTGWARRPAPALPSAQDCALAQAVAEPTWVRAHCLRGIASHAPERTAANGWAGPRSGTCGVSREPIPAVTPRQTQVPPCFEL
jgi:hypothetical protein